MLFPQFDRRRSVFIRLLATLFLVFFVATLAIGVASFGIIRTTVVRQTYEHNLETLRQTSRIIETVLDSTDRMAVRLSQNRTVQSVVLADWKRIADHYPALRQVRVMIEDELASSPYIHSAYLVSPVNERVLSVYGIIRLEDFADARLLDTRAPGTASSRWAGPRVIQDIAGRSSTVISLLVNIPVGRMRDRGLLIVNLDERLFYDTIVSRNHDDAGMLAILNEESVVLSVADKSLLLERLALSDLYPTIGSDDGYSVVSTADGRRFVSVITSPYNGWRYVSSRPYSNVVAASRRVLYLSMALSAVFLSVGLVLSLVVSRRFYRPIESLLTLVGNRKGPGGTPEVRGAAAEAGESGAFGSPRSDEFELIYASVDTLLRENRGYQERYAAMDTILREHFLIDLVLGRTKERTRIRHEAEEFGIPLDAEAYTIVVLRIVAGQLQPTAERPALRDLRYRVYGVASGALRRHTDGFVVDFGKTDLVIAVFSGSTDPVDLCRRIAGEIHDVIAADLGIGTVYGVGTARDSYDELPVSYDQAVIALDYASATESGSVVAMEDVVSDARLHSVVLSHRRGIDDFLLAFRRQDYDGAVERADAFLVAVVSDTRLGRLHSTMLMHELLSSFLSLLVSFDLDLDDVYGTDAHLFHDFAAHARTSPEAAREWVRDRVRAAAHHLVQRGSIRRRDFVGRMEEYVADRFAEPIGLAEAAEHASMNRQYFCSVFKNAFGTTFGDYLTRHRVQRATELLTTTTRSITEIASGVGYTSSRSFIRAFRQAKGLTPTRYRLSMTASRAGSAPGPAGSPGAVHPAGHSE